MLKDPDRDHFVLTGCHVCLMLPIKTMQTIKNSGELGAAVRAERKRLKVTQKALGMTAGIGLRFIRELELGKPTARIDGVFKVLQALGIKLAIETSESMAAP